MDNSNIFVDVSDTAVDDWTRGMLSDFCVCRTHRGCRGVCAVSVHQGASFQNKLFTLVWCSPKNKA